jgi:hypothetical protein
MQLGRHLRELWHNRVGLIAAILLASLAALWSVGKISLFPPGVKPRVLSMSAASTRALVDAPDSVVLDLAIPTGNLQSMTNRGVLVGNVMASQPVRQYIGRRAKIDPNLLQIASPITPDFPRPLATSGKRSTRDILNSPDQYRLSIQANPTVPVLDIYADAPTPELAQQLANGAVDGMQDYLRDLGNAQGVPAAQRVHLEQLGRAKGGVIDPGVRIKFAGLSFFVVFAASSMTALALTRVRRGWKLEGASRAQAGAGA